MSLPDPKEMVKAALDGRLFQFVIPIPAVSEEDIDDGVVCDFISDYSKADYGLIGWSVDEIEEADPGDDTKTFFISVAVSTGPDFISDFNLT